MQYKPYHHVWCFAISGNSYRHICSNDCIFGYCLILFLPHYKEVELWGIVQLASSSCLCVKCVVVL